MKHQYSHATVGGTFDHLHAGHVQLLYAAFEAAESVSIAITSDEFTKGKKFKESIQSFEARKQEVINFLTSKDLLKRAKLFEIHDAYAFALTDSTLDSIIVTEETVKNAEKINALRKKNKLRPLAIIRVPFHKGFDGDVISSTSIREGAIDRNGFNFLKLFTRTNRIMIPEHVKERLRVPLGYVAKDTHQAVEELRKRNSVRLITVGDAVTNSLKEAGVSPDVVVIDYRTRREILPSTSRKQGLLNTAGTIESSTVEKMIKMLREGKNKTIVIEGEEDLLALPAMLLSPLGSVVVYGQYDLGVVIVPITEGLKEKVRILMLEILETSSEQK